MRANSVVFEKLPGANNCTLGEISPNLATLVPNQKNPKATSNSTRTETWRQILRLLNLQLQRQRCGSLEHFTSEENNFILKTRHAISCVVTYVKEPVCGKKYRVASNM
jgi:hypothetical protein